MHERSTVRSCTRRGGGAHPHRRCGGAHLAAAVHTTSRRCTPRVVCTGAVGCARAISVCSCTSHIGGAQRVPSARATRGVHRRADRRPARPPDGV